MRFLVVDDSATMRRIVVNSLQRIGYADVVEAADGREALDKLDATIGLIITDWNMPNMGGVELAREVRSREAYRTLPMLMITARSVREDILTALESGLNYYIVKPFTPQVLRERIDAMLAPGAAPVSG
jgi:two-component system, chemotaxis family, chemotaxis protein CheY